jgi:hypothetical protein
LVVMTQAPQRISFRQGVMVWYSEFPISRLQPVRQRITDRVGDPFNHGLETNGRETVRTGRQQATSFKT